MRTGYLISLALVAGIAAIWVSRRRAGPMDAEHVQVAKKAVAELREIARRAREKMAALRKERRGIVDAFARKADVLRADKVKKHLETL